MNYELAYAIGFHPWERLGEHPPFADKLMELVAREEDEYGPRYGPALDLGTGSAVWGVRLAQRGWEVTGIDIVEKALRAPAELPVSPPLGSDRRPAVAGRALR